MSAAGHHNNPLRGIVTMIVAALLLTLNDAASKYLTESFSIWQVMSLRHLFSLVVIFAYIHFATGWRTLEVVNRPALVLRSIFFVSTTGLIVASFAVLPLAFVTAIAFSSPIFVVALSHGFGVERVGIRRWAAVIIGFVGVLVIVRPGAAAFDWLWLLPVAAALSGGLRDIVTRRLSRTDSSISILLWCNVAAVAFAGIMTVLTGWRGVDPWAWGLLALNGLLSASAHFLIIDAMRFGEASLISPFRYSGLLWATILGLFIWSEFPDGWTLVGALLLIVSGIYIIEREPKAQPGEGA